MAVTGGSPFVEGTQTGTFVSRDLKPCQEWWGFDNLLSHCISVPWARFASFFHRLGSWRPEKWVDPGLSFQRKLPETFLFGSNFVSWIIIHKQLGFPWVSYILLLLWWLLDHFQVVVDHPHPLMLQAFEVVNIKERFLVDVAAAGGAWLEATESSFRVNVKLIGLVGIMSVK